MAGWRRSRRSARKPEKRYETPFSILRYPGSKSRQVGAILQRLPRVESLTEPFVGMGALTLAAVRRGGLEHVHLNDAEPGVADLWVTLTGPARSFERLLTHVERYTPSAQDFYELKQKENRTAFDTIVIHSISYSGLGPMAGSPIGGRDQKGEHKVGARWNPTRLQSTLRRVRETLDPVEVEVTQASWHEVKASGFWYLDPPYFGVGEKLYARTVDHRALAAYLRARTDWLLSYDSVPEVRALYDWARIEPVRTTSHLHHGTITDVLIGPA